MANAARPVPTFGPTTIPLTSANECTPQKRYRFAQSPSSGKIRLNLTPRVKALISKRKVELVYSLSFEDEQDGKKRRLIGMTGQPRGRINSYLSDINHPDKTRSQFARLANRSPEQASFGIVKVLRPGEELGQEETKAILATDSIRTGFNQRLGGGGGRCQNPSAADSSFSTEEIVVKIHQTFSPSEPKAIYANGMFYSPLSSDEAQIQGTIYEFVMNPIEFTTSGIRRHSLATG